MWNEWSINNGYDDTLTVDRSNNKRSNIKLTFNGVNQTIAQWSRQLNIDYNQLRYRKSIGYFFILDILSRDMKLKDVCTKYSVAMDDILERYQEERSKYTDDEIEEVMRNVYYK